MKILFICKYGVKIGMGHLSRSYSLASSIHQQYSDITIKLIAIGGNVGRRILSMANFPSVLLNEEQSLYVDSHYDIVFLDMLNASDELMCKIKDVPCKVSLSPIFNRFGEVDILFHRTKYIEFPQKPPKKIYSGLNYAIIPETCTRISTFQYEQNLNDKFLSIAISMGGGDAANKTLSCIKELKKYPTPITFWIMLGEGYNHSYVELVNEIKIDAIHEIILVRSDRNMWQIMKNCVLCILSSGITAYEAAFAGMPYVVVEPHKERELLLRELKEINVCEVVNTFEQLNDKIAHLFNYKQKLLAMHLNSQNVFNKNFTLLIMRHCTEFLKSEWEPNTIS